MMPAEPCPLLALIAGRMFCRHTRVHYPGHEVTAEVCDRCRQRSIECPTPRVLPTELPPPRSAMPPGEPRPRPGSVCVHRGDKTGELVHSTACNCPTATVPVYECELLPAGECTVDLSREFFSARRLANCPCARFEPPPASEGARSV